MAMHIWHIQISSCSLVSCACVMCALHLSERPLVIAAPQLARGRGYVCRVEKSWDLAGVRTDSLQQERRRSRNLTHSFQGQVPCIYPSLFLVPFPLALSCLGRPSLSTCGKRPLESMACNKFSSTAPLLGRWPSSQVGRGNPRCQGRGFKRCLRVGPGQGLRRN